MQTLLEKKCLEAGDLSPVAIYGEVAEISSQMVKIGGLSHFAKIGDQLGWDRHNIIIGEIIKIDKNLCYLTPYDNIKELKIGAKVKYIGQSAIRPNEQWTGNIIDYRGHNLAGSDLNYGNKAKLDARPPKNRKPIGKRLLTGLSAIDCFLPLCHGQRLGLFSGSGVGKSTLLADIAKGTNADIVILALIGERGREVGDFTKNTLGEQGMKKSIVFVATSDEPPAIKLRTSYLAMATAEYFRDKGKHVLLLFDSLTRFAEAHRLLALSAGETPSLRAFPPSTFSALAAFCERAGPGSMERGQGDISAAFSVLVAGSNMEEPVADMVRGILDGHVVLAREIAERGRYPAIDIRRSVSRSLPDCASVEENKILVHARKLIGKYEESKTLVSAGLYQKGNDELLDEAVEKYPLLEDFISIKGQTSIKESFSILAEIINGSAIGQEQIHNAIGSETTS